MADSDLDDIHPISSDDENDANNNYLSENEDNFDQFFNEDGIPFEDADTDGHRPKKTPKRIEFKHGK